METTAPLATRKRRLGDLTPTELEALTPYQLAAWIGKKVIHPGGRFSTRRVLKAAALTDGLKVLEVGCGVGTLAIALARRHAIELVAIDIDPQMLVRAREAVADAGVEERVSVRDTNVEALPWPDASFDRIIVESVTMFTDHERAIAEMMRVLKPGGILVDHEFAWSRPPTPSRARRFASLFGSGRCELPTFWKAAYESAGLGQVQTMTGPVLNFTPPGILIDEGPMGIVFLARSLAGWRRARRFGQFIWRINSLAPTLRYVITTGRK